MTSYTITRPTGQWGEYRHENDTEAELAALNRLEDEFGEDVCSADQWDADGKNDDGEPCARLLFWACEEDMDAGRKAIAQLERIGNP